MATRPFFSGRIPHELMQAVEQHRKDTGESKTDVLVKALTSYLKYPVQWPPEADEEIKTGRVNEIEKQISELDSKVNRLFEWMGQIVAGNGAVRKQEPKSKQQDDNIKQFVIATDNTNDNENKQDVISYDNPPDNGLTLTNNEIVNMSNFTIDQLRGRYKKGELIEVNGETYKPSGEKGKPRWQKMVNS